MKVIILTGSETRHEYFRKRIASDARIKVLASYCEGQEKSLENLTIQDQDGSALELQHVQSRTQAEKDFFSDYSESIEDKSCPKFIVKGNINRDSIVDQIIDLKPDLLVCYGSSLIKSKLLDLYEGKFLNVHLGLSPYYRGSGTNVWPLINNEPDMVGATFMHIDSGIDTGEIIHQIRADIFLGDSPHSIGNRLIKKMTNTYADIIANYNHLEAVKQPSEKGKLYLLKDFDNTACQRLYKNFSKGIIENYLSSNKKLKHIISNPGVN